MTGPWIVAFLALTVLVLFLAALVLGLFARVTSALTKVESVFGRINVGTLFKGLDVGARVPYFTATHVAGPPVAERIGLHGRLLLFFDDDCEPCDTLAAALMQVQSSSAEGTVRAGIEKVVIFAANDARSPWTLPDDWTMLHQQRREISRLLSVSVTPYAYVLDADSSVVAAGIPNSLQDLVSLASALDRLEQISSEDRSQLPIIGALQSSDNRHRKVHTERSEHVHS